MNLYIKTQPGMMSRARITTLLLVLSLASCTTINPYTRETQSSKAAKGALIGSAIGALLGAATGDKESRKERALKGAGIGAIAGGSVGYYMDVQEAKLRQKLENTGVSVTRDGDSIILNMPSEVTFDSASSSLNPNFFEVLESVALVMKQFDSTLVTVNGHTDSVGTEEYNMSLSQQRAYTVANYLNNQGVVIERLAAIGFGETQAIADNSTSRGKSLNRRVEISLDPIT